jgi:uncharacterized surface protein with fasciclin (FAS1) repeats
MNTNLRKHTKTTTKTATRTATKPATKTAGKALLLSTLAACSFPLFAGIANAQTTTTPTTSTTTSPSTSSPSTSSTTAPTASTTLASPLTRIVTPGDSIFQRTFKSSEIAANNNQAVAKTAWEVITTDAAMTEFADLVKASGQEKLFNRTDSTSTYLLPTNDAFKVLDQGQLSRLKEPRFKEQAGLVVRQTVASGRTVLADFTRRLPTGIPAPRPIFQESCSLVGGTLVNNVLTGARTVCNSFPIPVPTPLPAVEAISTEAGRSLSVRAVTVPDPNGGTNRFRILVGNSAMIEAADFSVKNGVIHTTDTLQIPANLGSLSDIVGRR